MPTVTYKFYQQNTVDDPLDVGAAVPNVRQTIFTEGVRLINADPDNEGGCALRPGFIKRYSGDVSTMFANDDIFLFQEGTALKSFNATSYTSAFLYLLLSSTAVFCDVNGLIVYSDGTIIRKVYEGADQTFPAASSALKIATPAGQCLALFYRRLLVGAGEVLCVTDPDTVNEMHKTLCFFPMGGTIRMIAPVDDGVYLSTDKVIYFLGGNGPEAWSQPGQVRKVADYPAIKGTDVRFKAEITGLDKVDGNIVAFTTEQGICYGLNGGFLLIATQDKDRPGVYAYGAAILRKSGGLFHYLTVLNDGTDFTGRVMNTKTNGTASYQGYDFRSIVCHNGRYFGCNGDGIYELTGDGDAGAPISAEWLSGVSNAGSEMQKFFPYAYLTLRCEGELEFTLSVDEKTAATYKVDYAKGREGVHKKRVKLAKGVSGGQVQIGWKNVAGCNFNLSATDLEVIPSKTRRVR